jgi:hypothetical protein
MGNYEIIPVSDHEACIDILPHCGKMKEVILYKAKEGTLV